MSTSTTSTTSSPSADPVSAAHRSRLEDPDRRGAAPRLRAAIAAELIKLRSVRSTVGVLALSAGTGAALVAGLTRAAPATAPTIADALAFPVVFAAVFAAVAGISLFTAEVQHRTLDPVLIAQPRRSVIAVAKTVTAAGLGTAIAVVGQGGGLLAGLAVGSTVGGAGAIAALVAWAALFATGAALLGLGVGMIVRHGTAAITVVLVWWLVVENLFVALGPARLARFLPFVAGNGMVGIEMDAPDADLAALVLSRSQNTAVLGAYVALSLLVGTVLLHRRDES